MKIQSIFKGLGIEYALLLLFYALQSQDARHTIHKKEKVRPISSEIKNIVKKLLNRRLQEKARGYATR